MLRPTVTPVRPAVRRTLGALLAVSALALAGPAAQARIRFPSTLVIEPLRTDPSPVADPGYLPLVGTPPLRWRGQPPPPPAPMASSGALYAPRGKSTAAGPLTVTATPAQSGNATVGTDGKPTALRPEDFLPFFQRNNNTPPATTGPSEGLLFAPARPALPTSSADYHQR
jgi:hypothetical protein